VGEKKDMTERYSKSARIGKGGGEGEGIEWEGRADLDTKKEQLPPAK